MSMSLKVEGFQDIIDMCRRELPETYKNVTRRAVREGAKIISQGIRNAIPAAETKGHNTDKFKQAIGDKAWTVKGTNQIAGKSGFGVGKKRNTFAPHGVFMAVGTRPRFSGLKSIRKRTRGTPGVRIVGYKQTGNPIVSRGAVKKRPFVQQGFQSARMSARTKMLVMISRSIRNFKKKQAAAAQSPT